ncbi:peroxisomal biogenesis factor 3 [Scheffersomyces xylosifermentans]|uniref:peroxisomal biogenesis factor 3 n=1 Tax=Scheffersomyces xylosifermentans TaxID=1304137 RepID=UPI00315D77BD
MAIFSSLASFFNRHKRKILITSTVTISIYYLVNHFVIQKLRDYQNTLRQELIFKQQIKQRFIQTQQDCYYTILALLPVLTAPVIDYLPVELITQALRLKKNNPSAQVTNTATGGSNSELTTDNLNLLDNNNNPQSKLAIYLNKSKIELWNLLKIKTITRTLTLIYSISGLLLITRLQLNILARRSYLESAILMAGVKTSNNDIDPHENYIIEQSYLSLSWWLLNKGWINLNSIIEPLVVQKFESINPKSELSIEQFDLIFQDVINEISVNHRQTILANLFPINYDDLIETLLNTNPDLINHLDTQDSNLVKLINETNTIMLDGNLGFFDLHNSVILNMLNTLVSNLSLNMNHGSSSLLASSGNLKEQEAEAQLINANKTFKLASFLAQLSVQNGILIDNDNLKDQQLNDDDEDIEGFINNLNNPSGILNSNNNNLSGNVYVNNLYLDELDDFSAGIYSNFE